MTPSQLRLAAGAVVIFEGLDQTGKSTQAEELRHVLHPASTTFAHMPTGTSPFSEGIAHLLESPLTRPSVPLASQLAHLASHAEAIPELVAAAARGGLVLDRWWWSTVAYGWHGGRLADAGFSEKTFRELVAAIWQPIHPSIVFVLLEPHQVDPNNTPAVADGYRALLNEDPQSVVLLPSTSVEHTHDIITTELLTRGLAREATNEQ